MRWTFRCSLGDADGPGQPGARTPVAGCGLAMSMRERIRATGEVLATLRQARVIAPLRPDKLLRIAIAVRREGLTETLGFAMAARRCPARPGLVDELGTLTWRQLDGRSNAFAAALQSLQQSEPTTIGIMCRNHRGFVQSMVAANRIGARTVLLNTSFAGPALGEVVEREGIEVVIYDEEFTDVI